MATWEPGSDTETYSPFKDDGELRDDIPAELGEFIDRHSVEGKFTIEILKYRDEGFGGKPTSPMPIYDCSVPTYEHVVGMCGPGWYGFLCKWVPKGGKARKETMQIALVGEHWKRHYERAKEERLEEDIKEAERKRQIDEARGKNLTAVSRPAEVNPKDYIADVLSFAERAGGKQDNSGNMMQAMGMMFQGMMTMMVESNKNNTQMLMAMMQMNNGRNGTSETLGLIREVLQLRQSETVQPEEKSLIREFVEILAENAPTILTLFAQGKNGQPDPTDPQTQKLDQGMSDIREKAHASPAFLRSLVEHMDKRVGPKMADQILEGFLNVQRPGKAGKPTPEGSDETIADNANADDGAGE